MSIFFTLVLYYQRNLPLLDLAIHFYGLQNQFQLHILSFNSRSYIQWWQAKFTRSYDQRL